MQVGLCAMSVRASIVLYNVHASVIHCYLSFTDLTNSKADDKDCFLLRRKSPVISHMGVMTKNVLKVK